ncbi:MAG TPA: hypothetical protein VNL17_06465 [Verrucomicrobiae bacterium]|nr:hypothetical protein [Verrucomicrobiae bacterium]
MPSQYPQFDRARLKLKPLAERVNDLQADHWLTADQAPIPFEHPELAKLADRILLARKRGAAVILMMGAHVLRAGVSAHIIDLIERGLLTHVAMNGAGPIHEYELARIGATTESVARYIQTGEFGLWNETGELNEVVNAAARDGLGFGEGVGKRIAESNFPHKQLSVLAAAWRHRVPATVHVGIGYDIIHEHPNFNAAATGETSYRDFLIFTKSVENLEGGVLLCFGSAVMGPEIYLKALSMARNTAIQDGRSIKKFTTAAFDLIKIDGDWRTEAEKSNPQYYYRPWKTILVRTVAEGGESFYFCGDHRATLPALHHLLLQEA